jgi:tetratricopeptide (TPR) repeat protein
MNCLNCNTPFENTYICPHCGYEDSVAKKVIYSSNWHYNQGLEKARIRDLSGAASSLRQSLKYNKRNIDARNLLGLVYYQMGEIVSALSEWVISVHFRQTDNPASEYIEAIQNSPDRLKEANKVIRKYNMALEYVHENNADLAIIELKKVVNLSPTYVRAYQLLGLLYIQRKQYAAARKVLARAVKVDRNNMTTMRYLRELNQLHGKSSKRKADSAESMRINDPNPVVIEENSGRGYNDYNTGFLSFINVLIGIVIGVAVIWLLVVPSVTKRKASEYNQAVVEYSAQISERNKEVSSLTTQLQEVQAELDQYKATVGEAVDDAGASEDKLISAMLSYLQSDLESAGEYLADIEPAAIVESREKKIYELMKEATKDSVTDSLYEEAYEAYEAGDYIDAIEGLTRVLRMDESYRSAIFYMGRAYHRLGDTVNAASYYQQLIDNYPNSGWAEEAQEYLDQIPAAGDDNKTE